MEKQQVATRAKYLKKLGKVLPADKNLRFAQVENRLDLAVKANLAASIPLVPIEGRLTGDAAGAVMILPGVPGGAVVQTSELTATVRFEDGTTRTFRVRPDVDLEQRQVGEMVVFHVTERVALRVERP